MQQTSNTNYTQTQYKNTTINDTTTSNTWTIYPATTTPWFITRNEYQFWWMCSRRLLLTCTLDIDGMPARDRCVMGMARISTVKRHSPKTSIGRRSGLLRTRQNCLIRGTSKLCYRYTLFWPIIQESDDYVQYRISGSWTSSVVRNSNKQ
jgi:hypothetical protein